MNAKVVNKEYQYSIYDLARVINWEIVNSENWPQIKNIARKTRQYVIGVCLPTVYENAQLFFNIQNIRHNISQLLKRLYHNYKHHQLDFKILIPVLADEHWIAKEIIINRCRHNKEVDLHIYHYDPETWIFEHDAALERVLCEFITQFEKKQIYRVTCGPSEYPCQQNNDASCGPITSNFIVNRALDKPLPEKGYYDYGAYALRFHQLKAFEQTPHQLKRFFNAGAIHSMRFHHQRKQRSAYPHNLEPFVELDDNFDYLVAFYKHRYLNCLLSYAESKQLQTYDTVDEWAKDSAVFYLLSNRSSKNIERMLVHDYVSLNAMNYYSLFADLTSHRSMQSNVIPRRANNTHNP